MMAFFMAMRFVVICLSDSEACDLALALARHLSDEGHCREQGSDLDANTPTELSIDSFFDAGKLFVHFFFKVNEFFIHVRAKFGN